MLRSIRYSRLSHPLENLSRSITPALTIPGTLDYYLASVPATPQRMIPEPNGLTDSTPYAPPLSSANNIINNSDADIFSFEHLPSSNQGKRKEPIRPKESVANGIIEVPEVSQSVSPIKKRIRRAKRTSVLHTTAPSSRPRRDKSLPTKLASKE